MRRAAMITVPLALALLTFSPAMAEDVTVPSGRATEVSSFSFYNGETCGSMQYPRINVSPEPKHGKVTTKRARLKISDKSSACVGRLANTIVITYQSDRGYRGTDSFGIQAIQSDPAFVSGAMEETFTVTVR
jgi:hypothetical protein